MTSRSADRPIIALRPLGPLSILSRPVFADKLRVFRRLCSAPDTELTMDGVAERGRQRRDGVGGGGDGARRILVNCATPLRANGSRECAPDDRLREAIQSVGTTVLDCFGAGLTIGEIIEFEALDAHPLTTAAILRGHSRANRPLAVTHRKESRAGTGCGSDRLRIRRREPRGFRGLFDVARWTRYRRCPCWRKCRTGNVPSNISRDPARCRSA